MLRIAICDDQPRELEILNDYITEYLTKHTLEAETQKFSHPDPLITAIEGENFHLYILDIVMPMVSGPKVEKKLPVVTKVPDKSDTDQYGAYSYYSLLKNISTRMTPNEGLDEKIFDMHIAGFDDAYTYLDFYPAQQADGTISAPVLFKHIQRTWAERQKVNQVKVSNRFLEAVSGTLDWKYYFGQAKTQYLDNQSENVDVVVFGHTHVPTYQDLGGGKYYLNDGTWIDQNTDYPDATRTFAVITTGDKDTAVLYKYTEDGMVADIGASVNKETDG